MKLRENHFVPKAQQHQQKAKASSRIEEIKGKEKIDNDIESSDVSTDLDFIEDPFERKRRSSLMINNNSKQTNRINPIIKVIGTIFGNKQDEPREHAYQRLFAQEMEEESFIFMSMLPPPSRFKAYPILPPIKDSKQYTLVLDLDETLVHCGTSRITPSDKKIFVEFNNTEIEVFVSVRPYTRSFLKKISKYFEIIIFTASMELYAGKVVNLIDPERKYISHTLFRDGCKEIEGNYVKDLRVLGRDLSKTIIVDNSPHAYAFQMDNGVPIPSYLGSDLDQELKYLYKFLKELLEIEDIRPIVRNKFKTYQRVAMYK